MTAKGYWIVHVSVTDPANYPKILEMDGPILEKYGAKFLVRGGRYEAAEGSSRFRHIVIEFDSYAAALACYHSEEYQVAAKLRKTYAQAELLICEGQPT